MKSKQTIQAAIIGHTLKKTHQRKQTVCYRCGVAWATLLGMATTMCLWHAKVGTIDSVQSLISIGLSVAAFTGVLVNSKFFHS